MTSPLELCRSLVHDPMEVCFENSGDFFSNFLQEKDKITTSANKEEPASHKLKLMCLWDNCESSFESVNNWESFKTFENHVTNHYDKSLFSSVKSTADDKKPIIYECCWQGCTWELNDLDSSVDSEYLVKKHLSEHAHHSRLISIGASYAIHFALPVCKIEERYIPEFPQIFRCQWLHCPNSLDIFTCPLLFYAHVIEHAEWVTSTDSWDKNEVACEWQGCNGRYRSKSKLRVHLRSHTGEKRIACYICGSCFVNTSKYKDHLNRQNDPTDNNIYCEICDRSFHNEKTYVEHSALHARPYFCSLCEFASGTRSNLKKHYLFKHTDARPFLCDMCEKCYKSSSDLNDHIKTHFTENKAIKPISNIVVRKFGCHLCDKKFSRGHLVTRHLVEIHNHQKQHSKSYSYVEKDDGYFYLKDEFRE